MLPNIFLSLQSLGFYWQSSDGSNGGMVCCVGPVVLILGLFAFVGWLWWNTTRQERLRAQMETANMSAEEKDRYFENKLKEKQKADTLVSYGQVSPAMVCPHCQTKGQVRTKRIMQKKGISGGKATGAVLTGGISVLATGLSREEEVTQAHCDNCDSTWHF